MVHPSGQVHPPGRSFGILQDTVNELMVRILLECILVTARKRSLRRLCFYMCLSVHGGVPAPVGVCGDPPGDGYCCGRYASYWNAFLFSLFFPRNCMKLKEIGPRGGLSLAPPLRSANVNPKTVFAVKK